MDIYVHKNGDQRGPFSTAQVREMVASGQLQLSDLAWRDGLPQWIPLAQLSGLNLSSSVADGTGSRGESPTGLRLLTAIVLFIPSFVVLWILAFFILLVLGGMVAGAEAGAQNPQNSAQAGAEAGRHFGEAYAGLVALIAAGLSLIFSSILAGMISFSNLFPWCRRR